MPVTRILSEIRLAHPSIHDGNGRFTPPEPAAATLVAQQQGRYDTGRPAFGRKRKLLAAFTVVYQRVGAKQKQGNTRPK